MSANHTVFGVVSEFAQKFDRDSRALPAQVDFTPLTPVLCCSVLDTELTIFLEEMAEVLEMPEYTHLPRVVPWIIGAANVRGKIVTIIDLAHFLGGSLRSMSKAQRILVVELDGDYFGLLVDSVSGVRHFNTQRFSTGRVDVPGSLGRYVSGCFVDDDGSNRHLFSPAQLVRDKSFFEAVV